jgi:hypothetical protein
MNKICSVCKKQLEIAPYKANLYKCNCGYWKPGIHEELVYEDAGSKQPTLRFIINN